jgi:hypothetical protein
MLSTCWRCRSKRAGRFAARSLLPHGGGGGNLGLTPCSRGVATDMTLVQKHTHQGFRIGLIVDYNNQSHWKGLAGRGRHRGKKL